MRYEGQQHYEVLNCLLRDNDTLKLNKGVEVGVRRGVCAEYLLRNNPKLHLYLVDPYLPYMDVANDFIAEDLQKSYQDEAFLRLGNHNIDWIYKTSIDAAKELDLASEQVDFVFIDANHAYEYVKQDLATWWKFVRPGGLYTGHDYSMEGVRKAVNEFSEANHKAVFHSGPATDVWAMEM